MAINSSVSSLENSSKSPDKKWGKLIPSLVWIVGFHILSACGGDSPDAPITPPTPNPTPKEKVGTNNPPTLNLPDTMKFKLKDHPTTTDFNKELLNLVSDDNTSKDKLTIEINPNPDFSKGGTTKISVKVTDNGKDSKWKVWEKKSSSAKTVVKVEAEKPKKSPANYAEIVNTSANEMLGISESTSAYWAKTGERPKTCIETAKKNGFLDFQMFLSQLTPDKKRELAQKIKANTGTVLRESSESFNNIEDPRVDDRGSEDTPDDHDNEQVKTFSGRDNEGKLTYTSPLAHLDMGPEGSDYRIQTNDWKGVVDNHRKRDDDELNRRFFKQIAKHLTKKWKATILDTHWHTSIWEINMSDNLYTKKLSLYKHFAKVLAKNKWNLKCMTIVDNGDESYWTVDEGRNKQCKIIGEISRLVESMKQLVAEWKITKEDIKWTLIPMTFTVGKNDLKQDRWTNKISKQLADDMKDLGIEFQFIQQWSPLFQWWEIGRSPSNSCLSPIVSANTFVCEALADMGIKTKKIKYDAQTDGIRANDYASGFLRDFNSTCKNFLSADKFPTKLDLTGRDSFSLAEFFPETLIERFGKEKFVCNTPRGKVNLDQEIKTADIKKYDYNDKNWKEKGIEIFLVNKEGKKHKLDISRKPNIVF